MPRRGLSEKLIVVTRPRAQAAALLRGLRRAGARVRLLPTIRIAQPRSSKALDRALHGLSGYDAAFFTSVNAVESFFARARKLKVAARRPARIGAVGPATAEALRRRGWHAAVIPETFNGAALARAFKGARGLRVLLPRAAKGRDGLAKGLSQAGALVEQAEAYRTMPDNRSGAALRRLADKGGCDAVAFASPSAVDSFFKQLGAARARRLFARARAAAIGPVTAKALRARGLRPIVAPRATSESLVAALARGLK